MLALHSPALPLSPASHYVQPDCHLSVIWTGQWLRAISPVSGEFTLFSTVFFLLGFLAFLLSLDSDRWRETGKAVEEREDRG